MTVPTGVDFYAEINSVPLDTYGWRVIDAGYDELLATPPLRGDNRILPGAPGRRPLSLIADQKPVSIPLLIIGAFDEDGTASDDPSTGMFEHRDHLADNLGLGTVVTCVFHRGPDLPAWTGDVQPLGLEGWTTLNLAAGDALVRLDLIVLAGELEETGS